jgi:hypothetical protein
MVACESCQPPHLLLFFVGVFWGKSGNRGQEDAAVGAEPRERIGSIWVCVT